MPQRIYLDEYGAPIAYGRRWPVEGPPREAYSRTRDLDRFADLHVVARALTAWLSSVFDVVVDRGEHLAGDLVRPVSDIVEVVRIAPTDPGAAPLTFVLTAFPGVAIHAGVLHDFVFPVCGCDACDDDPSDVADELERTVRSIVSGGYSEWVDRDDARLRSGVVGHRLAWSDEGWSSSTARADDFPPDRLRTAREGLPADGRWTPWTPVSA
jgi:hypothetical protein